MTANRQSHTRRQRELRRIQSELERFYGLERAPNVTRFVREGDRGSREVVLVRESADELEIALVLPPESKRIPAGGALDDVWLQVAEGVSHFLYLVERARVSLPVTKLELELQAEVDKFVLSLGFTANDDRALIDRLFDSPRFLDPEESEAGARYRLAHNLAARFVSRVFAANDRERARDRLRTFYRAGQTEKIRIARAA
ncbi:MAG TPA: hypothetical protein VER12_18475 [Polyangiaceae bacterium]|nr:hypothetical protein [Polyangiaceae bacterium]